MRIRRALAIAGLLMGALVGTPHAAAPADLDEASLAAAVAASAQCLECHDGEELGDLEQGPHSRFAGKPPPMVAAADAMSSRMHAQRIDRRTPTCVACHGASEAHGKKVPGRKQSKPDRLFVGEASLSQAERNAVCQSCHDHDARRSMWAGSAHDSADVACNNCHKVHVVKDKVMGKTTQAETCYACHKEQRAQLARSSHHPVPEGKMTCSDCHNVHGSAGPKLAKRDSTNATCYTCHAEKRGPFVHAHQPVAEDCSSCHNPHGSTVQAMLTARPPLLCQQCHTPHVAGGVGALAGQPGVYPPGAPGMSGPAVGAVSSGKNVVNLWQGRSCMNCHTQVHGSNNPSATNPTPQLMLR